MLNNMAEKKSRLTPDERRRQLVGIGLRMLVEKPIEQLSVDAVAREAGISRTLLFHYFATKTDFHREVLRAAARRVARNVAPDDEATGTEALRQIVDRYLSQIRRRRDSYVPLVFGQTEPDTAENLRAMLTEVALPHTDASREVVHAWLAYVEDRGLLLTAPGSTEEQDEVARHCVRALAALAQADRTA